MIKINKDREYYKNKFDKLMQQNNYIPQMGQDGKIEQFVQCKDKYRPYYFVSSMGYVVSLREKQNPWHILKPDVNWCGTQRKRPQFRYVLMGADGRRNRITMGELIIEHFDPEMWEIYDKNRGEYVIHHKESVHAYNPEDNPQKINRLSNLQVVREETHKLSYKYTTGDRLGEKFKKIESGEINVPIIGVPDLTGLIAGWIQNQSSVEDLIVVCPGDKFNTVVFGKTDQLKLSEDKTDE